jgi:integrase
MSNFIRLTLYRDSFVLYYTKNQESYRYNLNIRLKNISKEESVSIKTQLKKRKFPRQLDKYRNFIEGESTRLEKIITRHKVEFGQYPSVKELRELLKDDEFSLNSELLTVFKTYLSEREEDFQKRKSNASIKDYISFQNGLLDYQQEKKTTLKIKDVNVKFLRSYFQFLLELRPEGMGFRTRGGLNGRTIKKRFDVLKNFFKWLSNRGINKYEEISNLLNKNNIFDLKRITPDVKKYILSNEQIRQIAAFPLKSNSPLEKVREMFIVNCYTGMRFSDLITLNRSHIRKTHSGRYFLVRKAIKTADKVYTVELSSKTFEIISKHGFEMNLMSNQKANYYLKELLKIIPGFEEESTQYFHQKNTPYKIYELVSFHTARRSFITNLLNSGFSIVQVMKMTDHTKATTLEKYVNPHEHESRSILAIFAQE